ncbi:hypothetical protein [Idiomarina xiamenensis]|uniref:Uncharacterized protein n=1 Tax=Idiomarina xiamenensis 10-D-4 TaxID=740709 RepID=K2KPY4_9GAMM|nr:hypothetical protein [Idiomarina xiamenensis]EKE84534.1 hypothetical protein A10D4_05682 [Idiomarina xiamenensis 10-D-4]
MAVLLFVHSDVWALATPQSQLTVANIEGYMIVPQRSFYGQWLGEDFMTSVRDYGVRQVDTVGLFISAVELNDFAQRLPLLNKRWPIHALHLHGQVDADKSSQSSVTLSRLNGYSVVYHVADSVTGYRIMTYRIKADKATLIKPLSGRSIGALDCNSAATAALLFASADSHIVSLTLARTHYQREPLSETKFANYLLNQSLQLAMQRGFTGPFKTLQYQPLGGPTLPGDDAVVDPDQHCGKSTSCERGLSSCSVLKGAVCNDD